MWKHLKRGFRVSLFYTHKCNKIFCVCEIYFYVWEHVFVIFFRVQSYNLILTISVKQKNIFNFFSVFSLPFSKVQANCSLENSHLHTPHLQSQARLSYAEAYPNFTRKKGKIKNFATCKVAKLPNILIILSLLKLRIFNK